MSTNVYIGLDVGGTKVEGAIAVLDDNFHSLKVLSRVRIPLPSHEFNSFINSLSELVMKLIDQAGLEKNKIKAIGVGLPGSINPKTNKMINGNTHFLVGEDFKTALIEKLKWPIRLFMGNDANFFALAECWGGAGLNFEKKPLSLLKTKLQ